jgi:hypothetical protein
MILIHAPIVVPTLRLLVRNEPAAHLPNDCSCPHRRLPTHDRVGDQAQVRDRQCGRRANLGSMGSAPIEVMVVVPEDAVQVLVRPIYQVDCRGRSYDVPWFKRPLPAGCFRSDDGPSGAVDSSEVDALQD